MVKIDNLLGGSVMDEFVRLSLEKGWIINKEGQTPAELAKKFEQHLAQTGKSVPPKGEAYDRAFQDYLSNVYQPKWLHKPQTFEAKPAKIQQQKARSKPKYQKSILIQEVQKALNRFSKAKDYGFALKEDAVWGPNTAKAWNLFAKDEGAGKLPKVDEHGRNLPHKNVLLWAMNQYVPKAAAKPATTTAASKKATNKEAAMSLTPQQKTIVQRLMELRNLSFEDALNYAKTKYSRVFSPKPLPKPEPEAKIKLPTWMIEDPYERMVAELPKHKPESLMGLEKAPEEAAEKARKEVESPMRVIPGYADDGVAAVATVVSELVSLANDLEKMGEVDAATAVDKQIVLYKEAADKLYDVTGEKGEDLINQAHPGGGPTLVPAAEEGGKVETIVEEHKKLVDKTMKKPTGKYAEMMNKLIATANLLEKEGDVEAAKIVDKTIASLHRKLLEQDPFVNRGSANEAAGSEEKTASVKKEAQFQEDIATDIQDFIEYVSKGSTKVGLPEIYWATLDKIVDKLKPFVRVFKENRKLNMGIKENLNKVYNDIKKLKYVVYSAYPSMQIMMKKYTGNQFYFMKQFYNIWVSISEKENSMHARKMLGIKEKGVSPKEKALKKYMATLDKAIDALKSEKAKKVFKGKEGKYVGVLEREKAKASSYDKNKLNKRNDAVYYYLYNYLKSMGLPIIEASYDPDFKIVVADEMIDLLKHVGRNMPKPPAKKKPTKQRGRVVPRSKGKPEIRALQKAMMAAGFTPKSRKPDDGVWGPRTRDAYNEMMAKIKTLVPGLKPPVVTEKEPADLKRIVGLGQRVAAYLQKVAPAVEGEFEFKGKTINLKALQSPNAFVNELRLQGLFDPNSEHDDRPAEILQEMYAVIKPQKRKMNLESPGKHGQVVAMMRRLYNQLAGGWKKSAPRIPGTKAPEAPAAPPAGAGTSGKPGGGLLTLPTLGLLPEQKLAADELKQRISSLPDFRIISYPRLFVSMAKKGRLGPNKDPFGAVDRIETTAVNIIGDLNDNKTWLVKKIQGGQAAFNNLFNEIKQYISMLHELKTSISILQKQAPSGNPYVRY